jgi:hypothetical protein
MLIDDSDPDFRRPLESSLMGPDAYPVVLLQYHRLMEISLSNRRQKEETDYGGVA